MHRKPSSFMRHPVSFASSRQARRYATGESIRCGIVTTAKSTLLKLVHLTALRALFFAFLSPRSPTLYVRRTGVYCEVPRSSSGEKRFRMLKILTEQ